MDNIRVIVADDHPFVRIGIRKILSKTGDIVVVGEAGDGEQALQLIDQHEPDVLLLDVEMPRMNGFEVAAHLREAKSPVKILVLSAYDDRHHIQGMLNGGVSGYLTKEEVPDALVKAVRGVARGEQGWVSQRLAEKMSTWKTSPVDRISLTPRQEEVLQLVIQQKPNHEIAKTLEISEQTVLKHIEMLCAQFGANSLAELIAFARRRAPQ